MGNDEKLMDIINRKGPYKKMTDIQAGLEAGKIMGLPNCQKVEVIVETEEKKPIKNEG